MKTRIELNDNERKIEHAYAECKNDIACLLGWFECELQKTPAVKNWAHVGTLSQTRTNLMDALSFLSGQSREAVADLLIEAWAERMQQA